MDSRAFDDLVRDLSPPSRRNVLSLILAALLAAFGAGDEITAKRKKHRQQRRRRRGPDRLHAEGKGKKGKKAVTARVCRGVCGVL
jgi:hypothetical protein